MDKKQDEKSVKKLTIDEIHEVSGGLGDETGEETGDDTQNESQDNDIQNYIPGKKSPRR